MLRLSNNYQDRSILSLRTGGVIGVAKAPIINPNNLKIEGWYAHNMLEKGDFILPILEIRDFIAKGIVVNDHDALTLPDDMIRLRDILETKFELLGKLVVTEGKKRLGKIVDFAVDEQSNYIQKLYVAPPLLRGLTNNQILIDRSQIVEITDKKIIVSDPEATVRSGIPLVSRA